MESTIFMSLLIEDGLLYVYWNIDEPTWNSLIGTAHQAEPELLLHVYAKQDGEWELDEEIKVFGRENRWHIYPSAVLRGKRIRIGLTCKTPGKTLATSEYIDLPPDLNAVESLLPDQRAALFNLSGAGRSASGSCGENFSS